MAENYVPNEGQFIEDMKVNNLPVSPEHLSDHSRTHQCEHCGQKITDKTQLETHTRCHYQQTVFPSKENNSLIHSHDTSKDIKVKQEVVSEELDLPLDNLNNETVDNIHHIDIKIEENDSKYIYSPNTAREISVAGENICDNEIKASPLDWQIHVTVKREDQELICNVCNESFATLDTLEQHKMLHMNDELSKINAKFTQSSKLKVGNKSQRREFSCSECNKKFAYYKYLQDHMRVHTGEKPYSCDVCQAKFSLFGSLNTHMRVHTGEKPYSCDICHAKFTQSGHLQGHMKVHTGEKPYSCSECGTKFPRAGELRMHMRLHTGEKPYSCDICQLKFTQSGHLQTHMRVHTGDKPYSCDICHAKFSQSAHLRGHMRIHTGEKPYGCKECDKKFSRSCSLLRHMKIHTDERKHCCDICDLKFAQLSSLQQHK